MPKVRLRLTQEGKEVVLEAPKKANLLRLIQENEIPIGSACGGHGLCVSCKVLVLEGERGLSRRNDVEEGIAERNRLLDNERIACQCKILGDVTITTSYW